MNIDDLGKKIGKAAQEIQLSPRDKSSMFRAIMQEVEVVRPSTYQKPVPSPLSFVMFHFRTAIASVLLFFIISGSGISYAAASALPGDFLYAIKIGVNEPVQVALASSPEAKASLAVSFADQRLEEAGKLAALGRLTPELEQAVSTEFENQADQVNLHLTTLETTDQAAGDEISDQFEAVLSAHEVVLGRLALKTQTLADTDTATPHQDIAIVTEKIHTQVSKLAGRHVAYAEAMAVSSDTNALRGVSAKNAPQTMSMTMVAPIATSEDTPGTTTAATSSEADVAVSVRLYEKANTVFANAKTSLKDASISGASRTKAEKELGAIKDLLNTAKEAIDAKDADTAKKSAREALRRGVAFGVYLNAENYDGGFSGADEEESASTTATSSASSTMVTPTTTSEKSGKKWFFGLPR